MTETCFFSFHRKRMTFSTGTLREQAPCLLLLPDERPCEAMVLRRRPYCQAVPKQNIRCTIHWVTRCHTTPTLQHCLTLLRQFAPSRSFDEEMRCDSRLFSCPSFRLRVARWADRVFYLGIDNHEVLFWGAPLSAYKDRVDDAISDWRRTYAQSGA